MVYLVTRLVSWGMAVRGGGLSVFYQGLYTTAFRGVWKASMWGAHNTMTATFGWCHLVLSAEARKVRILVVITRKLRFVYGNGPTVCSQYREKRYFTVG